MEGTAEDFAAACAKDAVEENKVKDARVDFEWVLRGFLSYHFPSNYGWRSEQNILLGVSPSASG